jgi:hypothetical protein
MILHNPTSATSNNKGGFPLPRNNDDNVSVRSENLTFSNKSLKTRDARQHPPVVSSNKDIRVRGQPTSVVLCGCGNVVHVLTAYLGRQPDLFEVNILSLSHADCLLDLAAQKEKLTIRCINDMGEDTQGTPSKITNNPKLVVPECNIIIFALPANRHELYLQSMLPYLQPGTLIGSMPGEGGFDLCVRHILGKKLAQSCTLFTLETLPWACRIQTFGKVVHVLGTKKDIDICVFPGERCWEVRDLMQKMIGPRPTLHTCPTLNFLGDSLMNPNAVAHPSILYGLLRSWDGKTPLDQPPLFYQAVDDYTADTIEAVSSEILQIKAAIIQRYPSIDLKEVKPFSERFEEAYKDPHWHECLTQIEAMMV